MVGFVFLLFGQGLCVCVCVFAVWAGGGVRVFFGCCLGGCVFFFCWLGGGRVFCFFVLVVFCCLGGGACFFWRFGRATGVHSLTGLPGSCLRGPTSKKTKQEKKKKHGFRSKV